MKNFLRKLKLIQDLTTELEIEKSEFVNNFRSQVDNKGTGSFSDLSDIFSSSKNEYKGHVGPESFQIKKKRKFFDTQLNLAVAKGTYKQLDNKLVIQTQINGFSKMMLPFYLFVIPFYMIFVTAFSNSEISGVGSLFMYLFLLFHASLMLGMPYVMMRRSVKRMKHDLEREFFYMTKKQVF